MKNLKTHLAILLLSTLCLLASAYGQITPNADAFTNTADATTNYGANVLLDVDGATEVSYIQFNLSSIPSGASVSQATLKLYVNAVTTPGSFNVDYVNGIWSESTITSSLAPALGAAIVSSVPIATVDKNQYILIPLTATVQAWLNGSQANDGIALEANGTFNASFDSKENTTTSHPAELDIVFAEGGGGEITGITTASGSGLIGGGTSGTLNLSLTSACAKNQVLEWSGTAWACVSAGTGTVTSVASGAGLTGGPITGSGTLSINTAIVPQLAAANTFTGNQTVKGTVTATSFSGSGAGLTNVGTITGITTPIGSGLTGGGTSGSLTLSLPPCLYFGEVLEWSSTLGGAWACTPLGTGTITGVTAGTGLAGGGTSGNVTLNLNTANVPLLSTANTFTANQTVNGALVANSPGFAIIGNSTSSILPAVSGGGPSIGVFGNATGTSGSTSGVYGTTSSPAGVGVLGTSAPTGTSIGVYGTTQSTSGLGVVGFAGAESGTTYGVYGTANSPSGIGVYGSNSATTNSLTYGVYGEVSSPDGFGVTGTGGVAGVYGFQPPDQNVLTFDEPVGVLGVGGLAGVYGVSSAGPSGYGGNFSTPYGVWGDSGDGIAIIGTSTTGYGGYFYSNSTPPTLKVVNGAIADGSSSLVFEAVGSFNDLECNIDFNGNLFCDGNITSGQSVDNGARKVALHSMQSPENWYEDAGSGQLSNGSAHIQLEPTFAQTVNAGVEYHVFLTPKGDSEGLYVSNETPRGFEVHEQRSGHSSIAFDYRIMAKRKGYENVRLEDLTERFKHEKEEHPMRPSAQPQSGRAMPPPPSHLAMPAPPPRPVMPEPPAPPSAPKLPKPPVLPVRVAIQPEAQSR